MSMEITTEWDERDGDGDGAAVDDEGGDALSSYDPGSNLDDALSCSSLRSLLGWCSGVSGGWGYRILDPSTRGESILRGDAHGVSYGWTVRAGSPCTDAR